MAHSRAMSIQPKSRVLQFASYVFDASLLEIMTTLLVGGCVCVPNEEDRLNNISGYMKRAGVDVAVLTPSFAQSLRPSDVPGLRTLILGGEAVTNALISLWSDKVNLINGYGPSECSVVASVNSNLSPSANPSNIGGGLDLCWIVDAQNHDRLAPVGAPGELLIEGPTLARGYLADPEKSAKAFVENPKWSIEVDFRDPQAMRRRRMYKTGDLVKMCPNGTRQMIFLGRKDTQAKLNGQRMELNEVEHHLNANDAIEHAVVMIPHLGFYAERLIAVISLKGSTSKHSLSDELKILPESATAGTVTAIEDRLQDHLPAYMIPSAWITLDKLPLSVSGKLDRKRMIGFVEEMEADANKTLEVMNEPPKTQQAHAPNEYLLQTIWSQVLNLPLEQIRLDQSFLRLGGDSISAMQVMARCRSKGFALTVQDIIRSKSITDLVLRVSLPSQTTVEGEDAFDFDLSPIQQLYFTNTSNRVVRFNQSMLLRSTRQIPSADLADALSAIVGAHSMLRARFRKDGMGAWKQRITKDVSTSYRFRNHNFVSSSRMKSCIESSQKSLDVQKGPLIAMDSFQDDAAGTYLFITAHHLVIDVVSWSIILQDLEDRIHNKTFKPEASMSFQAWCRQQNENAQNQNSVLVLPHQEVPSADLSFWGMDGKPNVYGDAVTEDVELDSDTTSVLLGAGHQFLQLDIVDILLASILSSFRHVFQSRGNTLSVYNEGHGRESGDNNYDLSRTVGWFTSLCPIYLPTEARAGMFLPTYAI